MAILTKRNQSYILAEHNMNLIWFNFMADMIAQGWRVLGSGDGVSFENLGQKVLGASNGRIVTPAPGSLVDGETFTIDDGTTSYVFEFDKVPDGVGGGNVVVDISAAADEFDVRDAMIAAINGSAINVTAAIGWRVGTATPLTVGGGDANFTAAVLLVNDTTGAAGNTVVSDTVASGDFVTWDMTGGGIAAGGSGGAYHLFTSAPPIAGLDSGPWTSGRWANANGFTEDFLGASWIRIVSPADADHYVEYIFQTIFEGSPTTWDPLVLITMCRDTQRFDQKGDHWQRPTVDTGKAIRVGCPLGVDNGEFHNSSSINGISISPAKFVHDFDPAGSAHWVIGDSSVDYDFLYYAHAHRVANDRGRTDALFGRLRTIAGPARSDGADDPDPYLTLCDLDTTNAARFATTGVNRLTQADSYVEDERIEDRDGFVNVSSTPTSPRMLATMWLGDTAVSEELRGTYGVQFIEPGVGGESITQAYGGYWWGVRGNKATGRTMVDTLLRIGRRDEGEFIDVATTFFKGALKNDLLAWTSRGDRRPTVERSIDGTEFRVSWGAFSIYWGAEEEVVEV